MEGDNENGEKIELINEWRSGAYTISELSREFGISRSTVCKYVQRYQLEGLKGLEEKCRAHIMVLSQTCHKA